MKFTDLKEQVIDAGLCVQCGKCSKNCKNIELTDDVPTLVGRCTVDAGALQCGLCYINCPKTKDMRPDERRLISDTISEKADISIPEISKNLDISENVVFYHVMRLNQLGLILSDGLKERYDLWKRR